MAKAAGLFALESDFVFSSTDFTTVAGMERDLLVEPNQQSHLCKAGLDGVGHLGNAGLSCKVANAVPRPLLLAWWG